MMFAEIDHGISMIGDKSTRKGCVYDNLVPSFNLALTSAPAIIHRGVAITMNHLIFFHLEREVTPAAAPRERLPAIRMR